jgi:hypothetical protein
LQIIKPLQRQLGLRTVVWTPAPATQRLSLLAEASARPEAAQSIVATEAGRLEAGDTGWPLPGRKVHRGEVLAWLHPALNQREVAERRAAIADLDQKLVISSLTVERMRLQKAGSEDRAATGNVYYEQSQAEYDAMVEQRRLLLDSLEGRKPLLAPADGLLASVRVAAGEVAVTGQTLFELSGQHALRLVATTYDAHVAERLLAAHLRGNKLPLVFRGVEPMDDGPGWRLLFDAPESAGLSIGQFADLELSLKASGVNLPATACVVDAGGHAQIWLHEAAERYVPVAVGRCDAPALAVPPAAGLRVVTEGAALLAQYR